MEKSILTQLEELNLRIESLEQLVLRNDKDLRKWDDFLDKDIKRNGDRIRALEYPKHE